MTIAAIAGALTLADFRAMVAPGFARREAVDPEEWMPRHVRFPAGSEEVAFDFDEAPYVRGIIRRWLKDPRRKKINLCWGVRLGKTCTAISVIEWYAENDPCPMAIMFPDNDILQSGMDDHVEPMLEATPVIRSQLPPAHLRNKRVIRFRDCKVRLASGGKKSSVSGYPARVIVKIEHEKNPTRASSESDPSGRMDSRADGFTTGVKILEEGSPADKTTSRVAVMIDDPDVMVMHFWVPCPHCKEHQTLEFEQIKWDADANGRQSSNVARRTARYECCHCGKHIEDDHRRSMIQAGEWLAPGETIDRKGKIQGTPDADDATDMVAVLPTLYSLRVPGWGTLAAEYVKAKNAERRGKIEPLRTFWTEKLARVWDPMARKTKTHKVAERLRSRSDDHELLGTLPEWTSFCTTTCDVGSISEELVFYWMVTAWGQINGKGRGGIVDWGYTDGKQEFAKEWREMKYHVDGTKDTFVPINRDPLAIDSGDFSRELYDFVDRLRSVNKFAWTLKGIDGKSDIDYYRLGYRRTGIDPRELKAKKLAGAFDLFEPLNYPTQEWRVGLVEGRHDPREQDFVSLPSEVCDDWSDHKEFIDSLTADRLIDGKWQGEDNEYGDTLRYAVALANWFVAHQYRGDWSKLPPIVQRLNDTGRRRAFQRQQSKSGNYHKGWS